MGQLKKAQDQIAGEGKVTKVNTRSFAVKVLPLPILGPVLLRGHIVTLTWSAIPGKQYRVQYKTNLVDTAEWINLPGNITASDPIAVKNDQVTGQQRFYRVEVLP